MTALAGIARGGGALKAVSSSGGAAVGRPAAGVETDVAAAGEGFGGGFGAGASGVGRSGWGAASGAEARTIGSAAFPACPNSSWLRPFHQTAKAQTATTKQVIPTAPPTIAATGAPGRFNDSTV